MFEFYEMIKRWSYASAAASGGELWESRILDRLSFVSFWRFLVCITCWCKQHGWMLLIPVSLSYKKLSNKKHKGGLLVLSILWFSLLLLARYTPGLVRINFDRRWYALLRPRCPSVHCPPLFFGISLSDSNMLQVRHHRKTPRSPMAVWSDIVLVGETIQSGRR